tara:strand:- start:885 stop:1076 length:192 start_codon:yes stop_codon:yes gene_type:complete
MLVNFNSDKTQPYSYKVAIDECKRVGRPYKFIRYKKGGLMLCIKSSGFGWFAFRGKVSSGKKV